MTPQQGADILLAAYKAEVDFRQRKFEDDGETRKNIERLATFLCGGGSKFGVMFCGLCGNGKTTLLYALQSAINYLSDSRVLPSDGLRIVDAKDVAQYAKDEKRFDGLRSATLLAIEDMGREPTEVLDFGNVLNPVTDLLEFRYNRQLFTVITTNLTAGQVSTKYGKRVADRFNEMLDVIVFENKSYRK